MSTVAEDQTEFTFEQLSERAKEHARDKYREGVCQDDWWDYTYEDAQRMGALLGIEIYDRSARTVGRATVSNPDIVFDTGRSDYCHFSGRYRYKPNAVNEVENECGNGESDLHRIAAELTALQVNAKLTIGCTIEAHISYSHNHFEVSASLDDGDLDNAFDEEDEALTQLITDFASWILATLQSEYDYMNSDEAIDEQLKDGLLFDEDGVVL